MNNTINTHLEPDEDSVLVDARDHSGIFVLNFAFIEIGFAGVAIYTLSQEYNDGVVVEDVRAGVYIAFNKPVRTYEGFLYLL